MSVSASIQIQFLDKKQIDIVILLLNAGWTFNDNGHQTYLPIGDNDEWDWLWDNLNNEDLLAILKNKQELSEVIGIGMTWSDSSRGGELIFEKNNSLIFNISNNRLISESTVTDFDWYLKKIVCAFNLHGVVIESISCYEYK